MKSIVKQSTQMLTRKRRANPFADIPMEKRLKHARSIDLRDNYHIESLDNGFITVKPLNEKKRFK